MCPKGRAKNDGNLEHVGKELPKPSRRSHGGLKDPWRSLERPEDPGEAGGPSGARCLHEEPGPGKLDTKKIYYSPNNACVWGFLLCIKRSGKLCRGQSVVDAGAEAGAGAEG